MIRMMSYSPLPNFNSGWDNLISSGLMSKLDSGLGSISSGLNIRGWNSTGLALSSDMFHMKHYLISLTDWKEWRS